MVEEKDEDEHSTYSYTGPIVYASTYVHQDLIQESKWSFQDLRAVTGRLWKALRDAELTKYLGAEFMRKTLLSETNTDSYIEQMLAKLQYKRPIYPRMEPQIKAVDEHERLSKKFINKSYRIHRYNAFLVRTFKEKRRRLLEKVVFLFERYTAALFNYRLTAMTMIIRYKKALGQSVDLEHPLKPSWWFHHLAINSWLKGNERIMMELISENQKRDPTMRSWHLAPLDPYAIEEYIANKQR